MPQVSPQQSRPTPEGPPEKRRRPAHRGLKVTGVIVLTALAVTLASTAANSFLEQQEKGSTAAYGQLIEVAGGAMNFYRSGDRTGQPLVLLSGLGTIAPALDFAPLIRELDTYDVIVVEGFGYGYSDMTARERTVENISDELHQVLSSLEVDGPYILVGHSIAGFYTLDYANRYPSEVTAVIGIDPTVPAAKADTASVTGGGINVEKMIATIGLVRAVVSVAPTLADPSSDAFTPAELEQIRLMTIWNYGNWAVADETARMASNAAALNGVTYPDDLPVLNFLSTDSIATIPNWLKAHEKQLANVRHHEIIQLEGPHYLHWTQAKTLATTITEFLKGIAP